MNDPPRFLPLPLPRDVLSTPDVDPMLRAGDACLDRELSGLGAYARRAELDDAKGDEGIGMELVLCEGDMGVKDGELPRGRLYGSYRSSGWAAMASVTLRDPGYRH